VVNLPEIAVLERRTVRFFFAVLDVEEDDSAKVSERELLKIPTFFKLLFEDEFVAVPDFWAGLSLFSEAVNVVDIAVVEGLFDREEGVLEVGFLEDVLDGFEEEIDEMFPGMEVEAGCSANDWAGVEEADDNPIHAPAPPTMKNKEAMLSQKPMPFFFLRRILFSISGQLCSGASGRKPSAAR
jgi:hypothetical protein